MPPPQWDVPALRLPAGAVLAADWSVEQLGEQFGGLAFG